MNYSSSQLNIVYSLEVISPSGRFRKYFKRVDIVLFAETAIVTILVILAIKIVILQDLFQLSWFFIPVVLVAAAIIPSLIKKDDFVELGYNFKSIKSSLGILGLAVSVVFPVMCIVLWLMKCYGLAFPLRPSGPTNNKWLQWLIYQFMYVSVGEEVFFRGYVQTNIMGLAKKLIHRRHLMQKWVSIIISAAVFAAAHIIVQGSLTPVLIFFPGLILGWLFIRTHSLVVPILFHGLANTCYYAMAVAFS